MIREKKGASSLAVRIIPCLDVDAGRVVKGTKFLNLRDAGDPVEVAKRYNEEGADELVFLDITASSEKRAILLEQVKKTAEQVFIPLTVGGGVRTVSDIRTLLRSGADKVSINTSAVQNPALISEGAEKFGSQCMVVAIDAKRRITPRDETNNERDGTIKEKIKFSSLISHPLSLPSWEVYIHGGRTPTGKDAITWAKEAEKRGAGEILLTSMDADGMQQGYDTDLLKLISESVRIPVIASGGAGKKQDFYKAWESGASACLAASLFHYRQLSIRAVKKYLLHKKVPVRI